MENTTVDFLILSIFILLLFLQDFLIDRIFKVVPEISFQLFVFHAFYRDHVLAVLFVLLLAKSGQSYEKTLNDLMQLAPGCFPQRMIISFEKAAVNMIIGGFQ